MAKKVLWKKRIWLGKSPDTDAVGASIRNWTHRDGKSSLDFWVEIQQGNNYLYFDETSRKAVINLGNFLLNLIDEYDVKCAEL